MELQLMLKSKELCKSVFSIILVFQLAHNGFVYDTLRGLSTKFSK